MSRDRSCNELLALRLLAVARRIPACSGAEPLHVRAGFPTSYLADVTVPGLVPGKRLFLFAPVARAIGRTPVRAAMFFFLASTATEFSQLLWPHGFFAGRFDPLDIVAYGAGLAVCYGFDAR